MGTIAANKEAIKSLRAKQIDAIKEGKDTFTYEGHEFKVGYAKYLIQYLQEILKKK